MIPKILHQIWLGGSLPEKFKSYSETWKKFHPQWQYHFWTDENLPKSPRQSSVDKCDRAASKSNIYRLEILKEIGGVYVDTDVECLKPIDDLIVGHSAIVARGTNASYATNSIIGAEPNHPWIVYQLEHQVPTYALRVAPWSRYMMNESLRLFGNVTLLGWDLFPNRDRVVDKERAYSLHDATCSWRE